MPKIIRAERITPTVVMVWYEGDIARSFYTPDTLGYDKWTALADEQAKEAKAA